MWVFVVGAERRPERVGPREAGSEPAAVLPVQRSAGPVFHKGGILRQTGSCGESRQTDTFSGFRDDTDDKLVLMFCILFYLFQMRNWKRRYFILDENALSYYKSDLVRKWDEVVCV